MKIVSFVSFGFLLAAASLAAPQAIAQVVAKQTPARSIPVKKVFPFYDMYLNLAAEARDGFAMKYRLSSSQPGLPRAQMTYVLGALRTPVVIGANGQIMNMPDMAMLRNGRIDIAANQPRGGIGLDLEPIIPLSRSIRVVSATNPLTDYASAVRRAGPLAALAPKLKGIIFKDVTGGEALMSDGRRVALPVTPRGVLFQPTAPNMRGAISLSFPTPPTDAQFSQ